MSLVIEKYRGDTKPIVFKLWENKAENVPLDTVGYSATFTVSSEKAPVDTSAQEFTLVGLDIAGGFQFNPTSLNMDLAPGIYFYDVELVDPDGKIDTVALDKFKVTQDITK